MWTHGAWEGDWPINNPRGNGINTDGLPDDPAAMAKDVEGANAGQPQG